MHTLSHFNVTALLQPIITINNKTKSSTTQKATSPALYNAQNLPQI